MLKPRSFALIFLLSALTGEAVYSHSAICEEVGFFPHFVQQSMTLTGTCNDNDGIAMLDFRRGGFSLTGFGNTEAIPVQVKNNNKAIATGVNVNGWPNHTVKLTINKKASKIRIVITGDENCQSTAKIRGFVRCAYTVQTSDCTKIRRSDTLCGPCEEPSCPDYGDESIDVFVAGKPGERCSVNLARDNSNCIKCKGKGFSPAD